MVAISSQSTSCWSGAGRGSGGRGRCRRAAFGDRREWLAPCAVVRSYWGDGRMAIADGPVRRIGPEERRSRLGVRHHLASSARAAGVVEVARDVIGLHATDPASVFLAAWARMQYAEVEAIELALYEERSLLKMLGMRRTMSVVPIELVPVIQAACTKALVVRERVQLVQLLEEAGIVTDGGGWLRRVEEATVQALS